MYDTIYLLVLHQLVECIEIADIHLHELIVGLILSFLESTQIARRGYLIQIDNLIIRILIYEKSNYVATDKTRATGDNNTSIHIF